MKATKYEIFSTWDMDKVFYTKVKKTNVNVQPYFKNANIFFAKQFINVSVALTFKPYLD